jgi:hypothetical protein
MLSRRRVTVYALIVMILAMALKESLALSPPDDGTGCPECGAVSLPRREDGTCWNQEGCRERQAAKAGARNG